MFDKLSEPPLQEQNTRQTNENLDYKLRHYLYIKIRNTHTQKYVYIHTLCHSPLHKKRNTDRKKFGHSPLLLKKSKHTQ